MSCYRMLSMKTQPHLGTNKFLTKTKATRNIKVAEKEIEVDVRQNKKAINTINNLDVYALELIVNIFLDFFFLIIDILYIIN